MSAWQVVAEGAVRGFGLLYLPGPGPSRIRAGKLVECLVDADAPELWHAAAAALTDELARQGADLAVAFGSTPWMARALGEAGFAPSHDLEFTLRDRAAAIPCDAVFHLSAFEADYAYT
jgi:hypothetical protein